MTIIGSLTTELLTMRIVLSSTVLATWLANRSHAFHSAPSFNQKRITSPWKYPHSNPFVLLASDDISLEDAINLMNQVDGENPEMDMLRISVFDATQRALESRERVVALESEMDKTQRLLEEKEAEFKRIGNEWSIDKKSLLEKLSDFTKKLQMTETEVETANVAQDAKSRQRQDLLQQEIDELKQSLEESKAQLIDQQAGADELRNRLLNAEDQLEFEQMRFTKETKELIQQIETERSKVSTVEKGIAEEQARFQIETMQLRKELEDTAIKVEQAETLLNQTQQKFDQELATMAQQIDAQKIVVANAKLLATEESKRFTKERSELNNKVTDAQLQLKQAQIEFQESQEAFAKEEKDLESKIVLEKARVTKLESMLESELAKFATDKLSLETSLEQEKNRLTMVEKTLQEETKRFQQETKKLQEKIVDGERVRQLQAKQMNERYSAIRTELTAKWEGEKRYSRRERSRLMEKYETQLVRVNDAVEKLARDLDLARQQTNEWKASFEEAKTEMGRMEAESRRMERSYLNKIYECNGEISQLEQSIVSFQADIKRRDETIERYESSYREMLKLSVNLTKERLGKQGRKVKNIFRRNKKDTKEQ